MSNMSTNLEKNKNMSASQGTAKCALKEISKIFQNVTKRPEIYLSVQNEKAEKIKLLLKNLYDLNNDQNGNNPNVLAELILDDMDEEQLWQQLELRNEASWPKILEDTSKLLSVKNENLSIKYTTEGDEESLSGEEENLSDQDEENHEFEDENNSDSNEEDYNDNVVKNNKNKMKYKPSIVDDKFFKLNEMEAFLNVEDEKERSAKNNKNDEIDYFDSNLSEDEGNLKYADFFEREESDLKKSIKRKGTKGSSNNDDYLEEIDEDMEECDEDMEECDEEGDYDEEGNYDEEGDYDEEQEDESNEQEADEDFEEEDTEEIDPESTESRTESKEKSSFELRQERLKVRINELEENAMGEKPWQLKGEIVGVGRPQNSLLEEILEFDTTTRPAPVITEETTLRLEDIIKQRIKDKAWDDVQRKFKPPSTAQEFRKQIILDQEKSKESLANIYEKEYRNEIEKLNPNATLDKQDEPKEHKLIKEQMKMLFIKLDALSNFHYTPKPIAPEPKIITNIPVIDMEEVAPLGVSDAKLLAPEEIKNRIKGDMIGKSERSKTDKNRERRQKKLRQKSIANHKMQNSEQQNPNLKNVKESMMKNVIKSRNVQKIETTNTDGTAYKSSKAFFNKLQDKMTTNGKTAKRKPDKEQISAKRLKL